jgi:hypothetical protein
LTRRGVPDGDMPDRPQPANWGPPPLSDRDLDELARSLWGVEEIMTALRAGPLHAELTGENRAMAEFRRVSRRTRRRRHGRMVPATRFAAAAALIAVAVCGAAAETGRLPKPIQNLAHVVFSAPTPSHLRHAHAHAHGRVDTRASWSRACQDFVGEVAVDRKPWQEAGYRALVSAADGSGHVISYCAKGDFPSGISYPGQLPQAGKDQGPAWPDVSRTGGSSPGPSSGSAGAGDPGHGHARAPGGASPGTAPSTSPGGAGAGTSSGATPGTTTGAGGGASSGGTQGWGPAPSPGPSSHYP